MALQKREHFLTAIIACLVLGGHLASAQWRQTGPGTQPGPGARPGQGWTPGQGARPGQGGQGALPGQGGQGWTPGQGARPGQGGQGARPGQGGQGWTPGQGARPGQGGQGARPGQGGQGWTPGQGARPGQGGQGARPGQGGQGWTPGQGARPGQGGQGARPGQGGQGWNPGQGQGQGQGGRIGPGVRPGQGGQGGQAGRGGQGGPGWNQPFIPRREPLTPMMTCGDVSLYGGAAGTTPIPMAKHCLDIRELGGVRDGVYTIYVTELNSCGKVNVYCDQTTDGGGWTVIQRRVDGRLNFLRNWQEYKQGFGFLNGEFWLGNDWIHKIAMQGPHELRVDLGDFQMNERFAKYKVFSVGDERSNYTLKVERYDASSNAGDAMTGHNNQAFTTIDRDNDRWSGNCARQYTGAWWYTSCHNSNLNGGYLKGANRQYARGIVWNQWRGYSYSLRSTEMKIRPLI
ncbi:uncharacterized protein [Diadema antillarum]|uniref:uncharacterized protein n=1 Tax=Diadema antillarum TaxID=105358 RepID=UPI003A8BB815